MEVTRHQTHYQLLGVATDATTEQIKSAYRASARKHHPDYNKDDASAAERFKRCKAAYDVLSNTTKRAAYDIDIDLDLDLDIPESCALCDNGAVPGRDLCFFCGMRIYQRRERQRREHQRREHQRQRHEHQRHQARHRSTVAERLEREWAWVGDSRTFSERMGRTPDDYMGNVQVNADALLSALMGDAVLRTAHFQTTRQVGGMRVVIELRPGLRMSVDRSTVESLRRAHRGLGAASELLQRVRGWFE